MSDIISHHRDTGQRLFLLYELDNQLYQYKHQNQIQPFLADILFHIKETLIKNLDRMNLTAGALAKICDGQEVADPVLQVLGHKPIQGSGQERSAQANTFCLLS